MKIKYKIKDKVSYEYNGTVYYKETPYWHQERKEFIKITELPGDIKYDESGFVNPEQRCVVKAPSKTNDFWTFLSHLKPEYIEIR